MWIKRADFLLFLYAIKKLFSSQIFNNNWNGEGGKIWFWCGVFKFWSWKINFASCCVNQFVILICVDNRKNALSKHWNWKFVIRPLTRTNINVVGSFLRESNRNKICILIECLIVGIVGIGRYNHCHTIPTNFVKFNRVVGVECEIVVCVHLNACERQSCSAFNANAFVCWIFIIFNKIGTSHVKRWLFLQLQ